MATTYIPVPIPTDPVDVAAEAFEYLETKIPGWLPSPGNLEAWLIEAEALVAGELRTLCALVPDIIFAYFGSSILGLPPYAATTAMASTTWQMVDAAGYTVPAGSLIALTPPASPESFAFIVDTAFTVPAGQTFATGVTCHALQPGAAASNLTGTIQVIDPLVFVATVSLDTPTSGGSDSETPAAYLNRLSALLTLLSPRPILPQDFAILAQRMIPGVARATAIDLYDPTTGQTSRPRCVTVAVCDDAGNPCSTQTKNDVDTLLQGMREVNFLVYVVDPTYTTIDVNVNAHSYPSYDPDDVATRVESALTRYLSPGQWGLPPYGDTSARSWINTTQVRYLELAEQINRVDGVHYIDYLRLCVGGGTPSNRDVVLSGVAPLTHPGAFIVNVTPET